MTNKREIKAIQLLAKGNSIKPLGRSKFLVRSESNPLRWHEVAWENGQWRCRCEDYAKRKIRCKHIYVVLYFMDGPGQDLINMTGMTAGGVQIILFTTGMGTPIGSPIAPVVKVTANHDTFVRMKDDLDVYFPKEKIFSENKTLREVSLETYFPYILDVLSGKKLTKSEENKQHDFQIREMWMKI